MAYDYNSSDPIKIGLNELTDTERQLLTGSKQFCMYPWIHLHAYPTGETWPCCHAEMAVGPVGSTKEQSLEQLWHSERMVELRQDMLEGRDNSYCTRCYEQEKAGFFPADKVLTNIMVIRSKML